MKKRLVKLGLTFVMTLTMSTTAFAGGLGTWQKNDTGWWWHNNNGTYPSNRWEWIDGNNDGIAECYYFDQDGYAMTGCVTPDGYTVNADGAWTENGDVQARTVHFKDDFFIGAIGGMGEKGPDIKSEYPVIDGTSVERIVLGQGAKNLYGMPADQFPAEAVIGEYDHNPVYSIESDIAKLRVETRLENGSQVVSSLYGPAKAMLQNIPPQGIEVNAFFENCGYETASQGRNVMASTGRSDQIFGFSSPNYRMAKGQIGKLQFLILLSKGYDGNWYIYQNSSMFLY